MVAAGRAALSAAVFYCLVIPLEAALLRELLSPENGAVEGWAAVEGAIVTFQLPDKGPGGTLSDRLVLIGEKNAFSDARLIRGQDTVTANSTALLPIKLRSKDLAHFAGKVDNWI